MQRAASEIRRARWAVQELDGVEALGVAASAAFVPLDISARGALPFRARLRRAVAAGVEITEVRAGSHLVDRPARLLGGATPPLYKVSIQLQGTCLLVQGDHEAVLRPGDLALYDTGRPYTMVFDDDVRVLVMMIPQASLRVPPELVSEVVARRFDGSSGVGAAVIPFLAGLADGFGDLPAPVGACLVGHAVGLLTTLVGAEVGVRTVDGCPSGDLAEQITGWIEDHLGDAGLGPAQVAAHHFISVRRLHAIFSDRGTTVGTLIRARRLERCRLDLLDPALAGWSVAAVGARWGFSDPAHFSHAFKSAFGVPPSRVRVGS